MITKSLQVWLIHKQWSGNTSARVSFFSRELGLIHCFCQGGRKPKKQAILQAFTPLWLAMDVRYERHYARTIENLSPTLPLEGHALFSALYLNELLYYVLSPLEQEAAVFEAYVLTLQGLASTRLSMIREALLRRFEWVLLHSCGHSFSWTKDWATQEAVQADYYYRFIPGAGFQRTERGIPGEHLLALSLDNLDKAEYLKSAKLIMREAINHLVNGREIKTRWLYADEVKSRLREGE